MAALEGGALVWHRNFGIADAETQTSVTDDSLFEAASTSKPVFAYVALQLVERGELDLDRPLAMYHRPPYLPADARLDKITARHALTHSSGLRNWGNEGEPDSFRPMFEPGARVSYSGEAIFWLQLVTERITGLGLDVLMRKFLFAPAGMNNSMFAVDSGAMDRLVYGHTSGRRARQQGMRDILAPIAPLATQWNKPIRDWSHEDWLHAAATLDPDHPTQRVRFQNAASSLVTTASDYARFLTLMMDGAPRAAWQISERLRREMLTPTLAIQPGATLWRGIGWSLEECAGEMRFGHEGNNDGRCTAFVGGEAKRGRGLVILTNADAGFGVYQRIVRAATGSDQLSFIANLSPP